MYTVSEFAKKIGFSNRTVLKWIKEKKIKAIRLDREYRIPESEYTRILNEGINDN